MGDNSQPREAIVSFSSWGLWRGGGFSPWHWDSSESNVLKVTRHVCYEESSSITFNRQKRKASQRCCCTTALYRRVMLKEGRAFLRLHGHQSPSLPVDKKWLQCSYMLLLRTYLREAVLFWMLRHSKLVLTSSLEHSQSPTHQPQHSTPFFSWLLLHASGLRRNVTSSKMFFQRPTFKIFPM